MHGPTNPVPRSNTRFTGLDLEKLPSPCFVVDLAQLRKNGEILHRVQTESNCKILLALKAYAMWCTFEKIRPYLAGTCCSGLHEAILSRETFGGECHVFAPAFPDQDFPEILKLADHISFNSLSQWERHRPAVQNHPHPVSCSLRINPQCPVSETAMYDPSSPRSRFGIHANELGAALPSGIGGLHFHNLCEQFIEPLRKTLDKVEHSFGHLLHQASWLNLGGGHLITHGDYEVEELIELLIHLAAKYDLRLYLEPGEAVVYHAGLLVTTVLDVIERGDQSVAVTDSSATCHMPDVLEMPYRPRLWDSWEPGASRHTYQIGGNTCLAGDVIGDFSFEHPLQPGQRLAYENEALYTMVKTTTFNGLPLPSLATWDSDTQELVIVRQFGYEDYKSRLS